MKRDVTTTLTKTVVPAEWAPQKAIWTAWPWDPNEWNGDLEAPRRDVAELVRVLSTATPVKLLVNGGEAEASARAQLGDVATLIPAAYGDVWMRDTGPIFARTPSGPTALRFAMNGWGGKYLLAHDQTIGDVIAAMASAPIRRLPFVLEGGAVDHDGEGTVLATRQTLLNPNRNGWTEETAELALRDALGARKVIWIERGLIGDHTDGHVDNIARFAGPGRVLCQSAGGADDPNAEILDEIARTLAAAADASGRPLEVIRIPGPGRYVNPMGEVSPASHMNFVVSNGVVVVPVYGTPSQAAALEALAAAFPRHRVVGVSSKGLMGAGEAGGGSFHCITQQEPL